jgi:hypothetical protein
MYHLMTSMNGGIGAASTVNYYRDNWPHNSVLFRFLAAQKGYVFDAETHRNLHPDIEQ